MSKARKLVLLGVLVALALALHVAERLLPLPILPVPGVKLGLANIVTLIAIFLFSFHEVALFVLVRTVLSSAFGGGLSAFLFSLSGGMFSMIVMYLLVHKVANWLSVPAISVIGALFHNIGQLLVASLIVRTFGIFLYLPMLIISAGLTGILVGFTSLLLLRTLSKTGLVIIPSKLAPLI